MGHGDAIMVSGHARVAQQADPRKIRVLHQYKPAWSEIWLNNPRFAQPGEKCDVQLLYARSAATNMRPYHRAKSAERWTYELDYRPDVGELYFTDGERRFGEAQAVEIVVEPNIKPGASPNKQWPFERWHRFAELATAAGLRLVQLGPRGTRKLQHATLIETAGFRLGCAVLARALAFVGHEGGLHHAAAALGVPGVVIFGGFTPVELTGYAIHRNLGVSLGDACGLRVPCPHCKAEMAKITPEQVMQELEELLCRQTN